MAWWNLVERYRSLFERFTTVNIECNHVTEDLIAAHVQMD